MAALDAQSNWNVEMSKPFRIPIHLKDRLSLRGGTPIPVILPSKAGREVLLPSEVISHILSYIPHRSSTQGTFWACALVSRAWYSASITTLYGQPFLTGSNFNEFVTTVCPSKNAHIRQSALSVFVKRLDMGDLVHNSSRSLTARLLGRLKGNIEEFVAPQASFAINSFAALSKCTKLRHLDLSLISASISNKLLFSTLKSLTELETLFFPRSSSYDQQAEAEPYSWPPRLKALHLAGGISDNFLCTHLSNVSPTLARLSIQSCPQVHVSSLLAMLEKIGSQLRHLTIRAPMPHLFQGSLDSLFLDLPSLTALRISADYISDALFSAESIPQDHPLRILDLECSPTAGADVEISATAIYDAVERGQLSNLRSVRVSMRLAWAATEGTRLDASDLLEIIEENEMERPLGVLTGVWWNMPD
ncbi:hypothetical protein BDZ45DRAFT_339289 [Acephala macrosclerotiorum]|nr:hypothetical protein BDZ45DRAFT_339289 [Acephala macrosclerotiorum]